MSAYNAIPIQAANTDPGATGSLITTGTNRFTGQATLIFDGLDNDYALVTGQLTGDVKFDDTTMGPFQPKNGALSGVCRFNETRP